jgi:hypothetical protein
MINVNNDQNHGYVSFSNITHNPNSMFLVPVTEEEVLKVTSKINGKVSAGYDEIPDNIVKQCIQFIKKPLTFIFNLSLCSGIFPNQIKIAKVWPIYKKGWKEEVSKYRPTSILPVLSKMFEMLVYNRVVSFLNEYNLISDAQNGFREKKSTYTAIQTFIGDIRKTLDNKQLAMGIFLDLSKALDVINHNLLLAKLELYRLRGKIHMWLSSYLTDRTQFVEIQHVDQNTSNLMSYSSALRDITHGVLQGSVLEPLLF